MSRIILNFKLKKLIALFALIIGILFSVILFNQNPLTASAWSGGNSQTYSGSTHYELTKKATSILSSKFSFYNDANNTEPATGLSWTISRYADHPDTVGEKFSLIPQDCHFYNYSTKKNLNNSTDHTAKERFMYYYDQAKAHYLANDINEAQKSLGQALHYLGDLAAPVHTGYSGTWAGLVNLLDHISYESTAQSKLNSILNNPNLVINYNYNNMQSLSTSDFAEQVAAFSSSYWSDISTYNSLSYAYFLAISQGQIPYVSWSTVEHYMNLYFESMDITLTRSLDFIATAMFKFMLDVNPIKYTFNNSNNTATVTGLNDSFSRVSNISIPESFGGYSVISIGTSAFANCSSLSILSIPSSLTSIESSAFSGCTDLKTITLFSGLLSIGTSAFFGCTSLTSVSIPSSVTSIGNGAFYGCTALETLNLSEGLESIGISTFSGCISLKNVTLPLSLVSIGSSAFYNCKEFTRITIPSGVTSIGGNAFYGCSEVKEITFLGIPSDLNNMLFPGCIKVEIARVPATVRVFTNKLKEITFIGGGAIPNSIYANSPYLEKVTIQNGVTAIGNETFRNCPLLTDVVFEGVSSVGSFGSYAFAGCANLDTFVIPSSVTSLSEGAFSECINLEVTFAPGSQLQVIWSFAFYRCEKAFTNLVLPSSVVIIGDKAFARCTSLTSVVLGELVFYVGVQAFSWCYNLTNLSVDPDSVYFKVEDHCLIEKDTNTLVLVVGATTIPAGVEIIGAISFSSDITSIVIPASVLKIDVAAFYYCQELEIVTFESGSQLKRIENNAFENCASLTSIIIPKSVEYIGANAFSGCSNLSSVIFEEESVLAKISVNMFSMCYDLENISIPRSVTNIETGAFAYCTSLSFISLERTVFDGVVTKISDYAFDGCSYYSIYVNSSSYSAYTYLNPTYTIRYFGDIYFAHEGTEASPYQISTAADLYHFAQMVNSAMTYSMMYLELTQDISLNDTSNWQNWDENNAPANVWTPIGNYDYYFGGTLNGNGHTISGMYVLNLSNDNYSGLFGIIESAVIMNLNLAQSFVGGRNVTGGIVGYMFNSTLINCHNGARVHGEGSVGGVVGYAVGVPASRNIIANCSNSQTVMGEFNVGGIAGQINTTYIINCINSGTIFGYTYRPQVDSPVGGIVGLAWFQGGNIIVNCLNLGSVSGGTAPGGTSIAGGIGGDLMNTDLYSNCNWASVNGAEIVYYHFGGEGFNYSNYDFSSAAGVVLALNNTLAFVYGQEFIDPIVCQHTGIHFVLKTWVVDSSENPAFAS